MNWIDRLVELAQHASDVGTRNGCWVTVRLSTTGLVVRVDVDGRSDENVVPWFDVYNADPDEGVEDLINDRVMTGLAKLRRG